MSGLVSPNKDGLGNQYCVGIENRLGWRKRRREDDGCGIDRETQRA